ncbi:hypothetical protein CJ030_MR6G029284 [Morella rubra]|uniref:Uncharacterized protein n=1 Tax=Morella rubra TaxID=262757 RepID=A0A6A1VAS1_9ROSI|nr:hypothetical protein CJ030_MR6G029284 [Morella rubra]
MTSPPTPLHPEVDLLSTTLQVVPPSDSGICPAPVPHFPFTEGWSVIPGTSLTLQEAWVEHHSFILNLEHDICRDCGISTLSMSPVDSIADIVEVEKPLEAPTLDTGPGLSLTSMEVDLDLSLGP